MTKRTPLQSISLLKAEIEFYLAQSTEDNEAETIDRIRYCLRLVKFYGGQPALTDLSRRWLREMKVAELS